MPHLQFKLEPPGTSDVKVLTTVFKQRTPTFGWCESIPVGTRTYMGPTMGLGFSLLIYEGARMAACRSTKNPFTPPANFQTYPQSIYV